RILKRNGTLFVCGFSEILADLKTPSMRFFKACRWLVWHYKNKANLGNDWGRSHESILHLRKSKNFAFNIDDLRIPYSEHTLKYPVHPQAETSQYGRGVLSNTLWAPNPKGAKPKDVLEIPTTCNGMNEKTPHPTQKPEELLRKIVLASSNIGDIVLDPFVGSGTTLVVAEQLQRKWLGCDINSEYLNYAIKRIELVKHWPIEKWIQFDFENTKRRNSIR
ncbi:MAG: site-specific DNA-methyltransferase, partial [Bacteroidales bacterium]|nr:site-specific DNA-methyltransferase [Bacteroidales bacterium]